MARTLTLATPTACRARPGRRLGRAGWIVLLAAGVATAEPSPVRRDLLPAPAGVFAGALAGLENPAAWATAGGELALAWDDDSWTAALGAPFGFALERTSSAWRYQAGLSYGDGRLLQGIAWRWSTSRRGGPLDDTGLVTGWLVRPSRFVSFGTSGFLSAESSYRAGLVEAAVRPLGTSAVTLFADFSVEGADRADDGRWSAGGEWRVTPGVHLGTRWRDGPGDPEVTVNLGLTLDGLAYHELPRFDSDGDRQDTRRIVRARPPHRGVPIGSWIESRHPRRLVEIDLEGKRVDYRKDRWFDDDRVAWLDLVRTLRRVRDDPGAAGVALNLSEARVRPALLWEMRRELAAIRDAGKLVVVQTESLRMRHLYLASVADRLQVDPHAWIEITGVAARRTYWKGLLDKLGIGFEEHRYFTYKTAGERYSREDMSDVDREQVGRFVDVIHGELVNGIASGRGIAPEEVARLGEEEALFRAPDARAAGLVDEVGRWEDLTAWARDQGYRLAAEPRRRAMPEERWGKAPVIALVYADGASEMDDGFRGRTTGRHLERLAKRSDVAAVVLRADSPGGDPMAAHRITKGLASAREAGKPVIATQGNVAASAGYSICLESDRIYTTPLTLTGSIGVISGWAWDRGLGAKTGFSADGVQRGSHADLFTGIRFPFVPVRLPQRNLDDQERGILKARILASYDEFVREVAAARNLPEERVRRVAEGRVWIGGDALERDLVDDVGTLADALEDARERAGLDAADELVIEEYPPRKWFHFPRLVPGWPSLSAFSGGDPNGREDDLLLLRTWLARPGQPCRLAPLEQLPPEWLGAR